MSGPERPSTRLVRLLFTMANLRIRLFRVAAIHPKANIRVISFFRSAVTQSGHERSMLKRILIDLSIWESDRQCYRWT
jgi:hypothetical protein